MNQKDQSEIEHSKASQDSMRMGAGPSQPDDDEGSITSGSPNNLLLVAVFCRPSHFCRFGVLHRSSLRRLRCPLGQLGDCRNDPCICRHWRLLRGGSGRSGHLGHSAIRRCFPTSYCGRWSSVQGGAAVVILGIAQAVCIVGANHYGQGWQHEDRQVAFKVASSVFEGGC